MSFTLMLFFIQLKLFQIPSILVFGVIW